MSNPRRVKRSASEGKRKSTEPTQDDEPTNKRVRTIEPLDSNRKEFVYEPEEHSNLCDLDIVVDGFRKPEDGYTHGRIRCSAYLLILLDSNVLKALMGGTENTSPRVIHLPSDLFLNHIVLQEFGRCITGSNTDHNISFMIDVELAYVEQYLEITKNYYPYINATTHIIEALEDPVREKEITFEELHRLLEFVPRKHQDLYPLLIRSYYRAAMKHLLALPTDQRWNAHVHHHVFTEVELISQVHESSTCKDYTYHFLSSLQFKQRFQSFCRYQSSPSCTGDAMCAFHQTLA